MDLDVINNDYNATSKPQLRFEETRNTTFLPGDSADYFCSVVRFSTQTSNVLPVFVPRVQTGQSDVNKTIYQVAITYDDSEENTVANDKFGLASVFYVPEDDAAPTPAPPTTSQEQLILLCVQPPTLHMLNQRSHQYCMGLSVSNGPVHCNSGRTDLRCANA